MDCQTAEVTKRKYVKSGLPRKPYPNSKVKDANKLIDQYKQGRTLVSLGDEYGLTRERIRQILAKHGINRFDGGMSTQSIFKSVEMAKKNKAKIALAEEKCSKYYGCDLDFKNKLTDGYGYWEAPSMKYKNQKRAAIRRGIAWELTLPQWWDIWQKSGHWNDRGLGSGKYVMARICDIGAYSIDNVAIITHNENSSEARLMDKVYNRKGTNKLKEYELNGSYYTVKELSEIYKLKERTIYARINSGYSVLDACTKPLKIWGRWIG